MSGDRDNSENEVQFHGVSPGGRLNIVFRKLSTGFRVIREKGYASLFQLIQLKIKEFIHNVRYGYDFHKGKLPVIGKFNILHAYLRPVRLALYTTDNWETASAHIRLIGPSHHARSGIVVFDGCHADNFPDMEFWKWADAIVIQRDFPRHDEHYCRLLEWAHHYHKPILYEIDDIVFALPDDHLEKEHFRPFEDRIVNAIRSADGVITSTATLESFVKPLNPNTWILPNYLDDKIWRLATRREIKERVSPQLTIGYMGGVTQTHAPDIASVIEVLLSVLNRYSDRVRMDFWGVIPPELRDHPGVTFHSEKYLDYIEFAEYFSNQHVDIFIAPLQDNYFNECKSALKFLEYSALGVPGIYSDVAPYREVIQQGRNGFLARTMDEWYDTLVLLVEDAQLRERIGLAALETVHASYLMSDHAIQWWTTYEAIVDSIFSKGRK